jgi:hypothetical protein
LHHFAYTGMKIINDEKIQAALEHQRLYEGQETQRQGLLRAFGEFVARLKNRPARNASEVS